MPTTASIFNQRTYPDSRLAGVGFQIIPQRAGVVRFAGIGQKCLFAKARPEWVLR
jgi:hypothetical protein